jgi:DnaJ-class molecular chaperone
MAKKSTELDRVLEAGLSHYQVLEVSPWAADQALTLARARMEIAMKCHPDRWVGTTPELQVKAHDAMSRVNQAYTVLSDKKARTLYDLTTFRKNFSLCSVCKGRGVIVCQRGFKGKEELPCKACDSVGHFKLED